MRTAGQRAGIHRAAPVEVVVVTGIVLIAVGTYVLDRHDELFVLFASSGQTPVQPFFFLLLSITTDMKIILGLGKKKKKGRQTGRFGDIQPSALTCQGLLQRKKTLSRYVNVCFPTMLLLPNVRDSALQRTFQNQEVRNSRAEKGGVSPRGDGKQALLVVGRPATAGGDQASGTRSSTFATSKIPAISASAYVLKVTTAY